jgi:3-hydroxybutyryl-CoA dehydrogenase
MNQIRINKICVCGGGTMGRGIAQIAAQNNFPTILYDVDLSIVRIAGESIEQNLQMLVDKGRLKAEQKKTILLHLHLTNDIRDCKADLIIEAIIENAEAKVDLLHRLASLNKRKTILATNTSSLSVSQIATSVPNPERVIGMHFFNPATLMKLVEVVKGEQTSDSSVQTIFSVVKHLNKTPVLCSDVPGFIVNRVARPYYIESLRLIEEGISDFHTIDVLLESTGFKMGPFKLMDLIGNDINFAVSRSVYQQLGEPPRLRPSIIQEEKVKRGELGRKTGEGYYKYPPGLPEGGKGNSYSPLQGG